MKSQEEDTQLVVDEPVWVTEPADHPTGIGLQYEVDTWLTETTGRTPSLHLTEVVPEEWPETMDRPGAFEPGDLDDDTGTVMVTPEEVDGLIAVLEAYRATFPPSEEVDDE